MSHYNTVLHQLQSFVPRHHFDRFAEALDSDRYVKTFKTWGQFTTLLYAQASGKDSLREIQNGLFAQRSRLYHLGLPATVARSTLADANNNRDYRVYEKLFYLLLEQCRDKTPKHKFRFKNPLYSIDSTLIDLCLSIFPWSTFRRRKGALKLHYQLDHSGGLPVFMRASRALEHDVTVAKQSFSISPDSIYCFDRGYLDWAWLRRIHDEKAFFVIRAKKNLSARVLGQHEIPKTKGVLLDETIETKAFYAKKNYPYPLRRIRYWDEESKRFFEFLTNNFHLSAATIAAIYKARWQIESFFRWIKQNLKIKSFLGTSKNAVMTQIWVAMCYYLLLAYVKYQTRYAYSLFYLHRMIRETLMDRVNLIDLLNLNSSRLERLRRQDLQLCFQI